MSSNKASPHFTLGIDRKDLQSRIYAQPDVLSQNKPLALKAMRKVPPQAGRPLLQRKLEPLPALAAYQKRKNEEVLKLEEKSEEEPRGSVPPHPKHMKTDEPSSPTFSSNPSLPGLSPQPLSSLCVTPPRPPMSSRLTDSFLQVRKRQSSSRKTNQSALYVNTDPGTVITKYSPPLEELTDPLEIVARLKKEPELGFVYLTPSGGSVHYNPYNLRLE